MFSELPTMLPSFLVLTIPMNLPKSRKCVRQRASHFREFHLHSTKETFHHCLELAGIYAFYTIRERFIKTIYRENNKIQIADVTQQWVAFFILELSTQSCFPGCSHRQLRGFRREEHTAVHVLCLFESVGRVAQNMSKKAWATNRKRSMSVGISGDSRLYKQSFQEIPLPSPIPYVKILTNSISDENCIILIMHPFHFVQHAADRNGGA